MTDLLLFSNESSSDVSKADSTSFEFDFVPADVYGSFVRLQRLLPTSSFELEQQISAVELLSQSYLEVWTDLAEQTLGGIFDSLRSYILKLLPAWSSRRDSSAAELGHLVNPIPDAQFVSPDWLAWVRATVATERELPEVEAMYAHLQEF